MGRSPFEMTIRGGLQQNVPYTVPKLKDFSPAALDKAVDQAESALKDESAEIRAEAEWKAFRDRWTARKNGVLTQINELWLKAAPKDGKRDVGQRVNALKATVEENVQKSRSSVSATAMPRGVSAKAEVGVVKAHAERPIDIALPGNRRPLGAEHPIIKTMNEMVSVFRNLGYSIEEGPEIETDYYNFESLNFPPNHPARDTQDTLFIAGQGSKPQRERLLLRTHTSPVQIRTMEKMRPPVRVVCT